MDQSVSRPNILRCLVYTSEAVKPFSERAVQMQKMLMQARGRSVGVAGRLSYFTGRFIHVMEGPQDAVREIFAEVKADPKQRDVTVILDRLVSTKSLED